METWPDDGQDVEVLLNGAWQRAVFVGADYIPPSGPEQDEAWWMSHFSLQAGGTYPPDTHQELPETTNWRPAVWAK